MNHRAEWKKEVDALRADMATCDSIEILSGPCAGMVIKGEKDIREYAKRLDAWMFPAEPKYVGA